MKYALAAMILLAGCRTTPVKEVSAAALVDRSGDSSETAVAVPADAPNGGIDFQNDWLFARYGRFRRDSGGTGMLNGCRYDVVKIELPSGEKKTVYFDITENWNRWSPK